MYLTQGLRRAAQIRPHGESTVFRDRRWTWAQTQQRVAQIAGGLAEAGVRPGDRVAVLALNSDRYFELLYALPWLGAVVVPINTRLATPEVQYILEDSGARVLFIDGAMASHAASLPGVETTIYLDDDAPPAGMRLFAEFESAAAIPDAGAGGDTLAALFYTGGTTGKSKGVMLSHKNLVANAMNVIIGCFFDPDMTYLHSAPMFHLADGSGTFGVTIRGGSHVFVSRFDPEDCLSKMEQEKVTHAVYVPTMINMLVNHPKTSDFDLSCVKYIPFGGSPISEGTLRRAIEVLPNCQFIHGYGMTEASPVVTHLPPQYITLDGPHAGRLNSCGLAVPTADVKIVDANRQEVPRGSIGEVAAKGPMIMLGYWNKPDETAAVLEDGWYYSGDAAYMDDEGFVFVVDRIKDMIISGGENIYSVEVENAISLMRGVAEVAVIGIPDAQWGEAVHAVIVRHAGADLEADAVIEHCRTQIAGYKCPRSIEFRDNSLPLSGAGKVLKRELRDAVSR